MEDREGGKGNVRRGCVTEDLVVGIQWVRFATDSVLSEFTTFIKYLRVQGAEVLLGVFQAKLQYLRFEVLCV